MNKIKFLVFIFFLTFAISCSQQKRYVTYKVKEGETMRDIAKRLDMRTKDLLKLNPDVGRKPNVNTTITIPNPEAKKATKVVEVVKEKEDEIVTPIEDTVTDALPIATDSIAVVDTLKVARVRYEYRTHTVAPKETVYALTKKYNISKDELLKLNPEFPTLRNNELSIGQVLKVEAKEIKTFISLEESIERPPKVI